MATHSAPVHGAGVRDLPAPSGIRAPVVATAAWIAGLVVLVLVFVTVRGFHVGDTTSVTRLGRQLVFNDATAPNARVLGDALQLAPMGSRPAVADLTVKSFPAAEAGAVMVDTSPLPQDVELALLWVRRSDPHVIHEQILRVEHGAPATTLLTQNPEWRGEIVSVALGVKNASKQAVTIHEVRLRPLGIGIVLADLLASWSYAGGWDGRSINVVFGGREEQPTYLPALGFAAAVIVSLIAYFASRRRGRSTPVAWLTVPFVASWLLLDLRWQRELFEQVGQTHQQFAGKSSIDREAAMENPEFFGLIQAAMKSLPTAPVRVFTNSDFQYFRLRAGYYLYPHNVLAFDWEDPSVLRPGDYLLLFAKSGVSFDAASGTLTWSNGQRVRVQALVPGKGQGLYRVN